MKNECEIIKYECKEISFQGATSKKHMTRVSRDHSSKRTDRNLGVLQLLFEGCRTNVCSGSISLHSHQQWVGILPQPHPSQHFFLLIITILIRERWILKGVLSCIFLWLRVMNTFQIFLSHLHFFLLRTVCSSALSYTRWLGGWVFNFWSSL